MGANFSKFITGIRTMFGCADWFNPKNISGCWDDLSWGQKAMLGYIVWFLVTTVFGIIFILGEFLIGGEGFLEDVFSFMGDFESIFEWLSSFIESALSYLLIGGAYLFSQALEIANALAQSTNTPSAIWIFVMLMGVLWALMYVIKDIIGQSAEFKSSKAYPFFWFMNLPISWIVEGLNDTLGAWAGFIAQIFAIPINIVIIIIAEILGVIWSVITGFF